MLSSRKDPYLCIKQSVQIPIPNFKQIATVVQPQLSVSSISTRRYRQIPKCHRSVSILPFMRIQVQNHYKCHMRCNWSVHETSMNAITNIFPKHILTKKKHIEALNSKRIQAQYVHVQNLIDLCPMFPNRIIAKILRLREKIATSFSVQCEILHVR